MTTQPTRQRLEAALTELEALIRTQYPDARFSIARGPEDPQEVHLVATVDVEDTDRVLDVVMERLLELQVTEGLPISVSPRRTPKRRAALWAAKRQPAVLPSVDQL